MKRQLLIFLSLFCLIAVQAQVANQPSPLNLCDEGITDEFAEFDLTVKDAEILGAQAPIDFFVNYYLTQADADNSVNPLASPYTNTQNPQTLYVRVEDVNTGSFDTTTLTIRVLPNPTPANAPDLEICDDDNDGFSVFDLTTNDLFIINGEVGNTVTHYMSQSDADFGSNAISDTTIYFNTTSPQTIFVRLENEISGCYALTDFDLIVNLLPSFNLEEEYDVCNGETLILDTGLNAADGYDFFWYQDGFALPGETGPTLTVTEGDPYGVIVTSISTFCEFQDETIVNFIDCTDTDGDGVIDSVEDLNNNGNLDDDDTDLDMIPNYMDDDDDGDNVDTIDEISNPLGRMPNHPFVDTDMDLIENYLDDDDDGDLVLTIDEDYNNNGDPTDDDTNMNSIPDYLESAVALSVSEFDFNGFSMFPNPAKDVLNIQLNNISNANLSIYDIQGKLIVEQSVSQEQNLELNVSDLQSGMYFVKLNTGTKELVKKLIIE